MDTAFFARNILQNQKIFLSKLKKVEQATPLSKRCLLAYETARFAVTHTTDIFASDVIEKTFLELAQSFSVPLPEKYEKDTILHVMTEAYTVGGHTRCVERWIAQFPEHRHSCIVLRQNGRFPELLRTLVGDSGGKLIFYDPMAPMVERAKELRVLASNFERVILHIHMDDPIALIAFGTEEFTRPIVFFNHADHAFWLGVSIADHVADLNLARHQITLEQRQAKAATKLGIPMESKEQFFLQKEEARRRLSIPQNKHIVFSGGNAAKYEPLGHPDFFDIVSDMLEYDRNIIFYIAGVKGTSLFWPKLKKLYPDNLFLVGDLDYDTEFMPYLAASDLVLDSYPVCGGTFIIDAIRAGRPVLTLRTSLQNDFLIQSLAYCQNYEEFLHKAKSILKDSVYAKSLYEDVYTRWKEETDPAIWRKKCREIYAALPEKHALHSFKTPAPAATVSRCSLETCRWTDPSIAKPIWKKKFKEFRNWLLCIRWKKYEKAVRILGMSLYRNKSEKNEFTIAP